MRYVAAYLLALLSSKTNPSTADVDKILSSVGIESDGERVKKVISELSGKSVEEIITAGNAKLASMPSESGAVAVSAAVASPAAEDKKETKKEDKKEESESEDEDMGFGLFD